MCNLIFKDEREIIIVVVIEKFKWMNFLVVFGLKLEFYLLRPQIQKPNQEWAFPDSGVDTLRSLKHPPKNRILQGCP